MPSNDPIKLTVLAPAFNEQENIERLVSEVLAALGPTGTAFEFLIVDDCSTDRTPELVRGLMAKHPQLRLITMQRDKRTPPGKGNGQSAAFYAAIRAARGELIGMLDADLQNDPADFVEMLRLQALHNADLVQGDRSANRKDNVIRRASSAVGRFFRRLILADVVRDTGCSLRIIRKAYALRLPLEFKGGHRFIPIVTAQLGGKIVEMPVHHRPRHAGESKYGFGITQRAIPGLIDCFAIRWMHNRRRATVAAEGAAASSDQASGAASGRPSVHNGQTTDHHAATTGARPQ